MDRRGFLGRVFCGAVGAVAVKALPRQAVDGVGVRDAPTAYIAPALSTGKGTNVTGPVWQHQYAYRVSPANIRISKEARS